MHESPAYGRDRRRDLSPEEKRFLYERANGLCQRCGVPLGPDWHAAHLVSYTHGGATSIEQMEAWCWQCNLKLGPKDAENAPVFTPRLWQAAALRPILRALHDHGVATLHAGPGAGKTFEAAWIFQQLYEAGVVFRLVVVVPRQTLIDQWVEELGMLGIHLDKTPRDGYIELQGTIGCVVCYQSLPGTARNHAIRMDQIPTLWVWDEVHHLAEKASWGRAARQAVGDVGNGGIEHAAAVLNCTGTLFRSKKTQRIATVRYREVITDEGERKLQAIPDFSVPTAELIGIELRRPDLYTYTGAAQLIDLRTEEVISGEIADLDKQQRQAIMRESFTSREWLRGWCEQAVLLLRRQILVFESEEPLKLLYIAKDIKAAEAAADMLNEVTDDDFSRLIVNDRPGARKLLQSVKRERRTSAIVAVDMVAEGFDHSLLATLAYASNKMADLYIAQVIARIMRLIPAERASGRMLPAQVLLPDNPDLRKAFASVLINAVHEVADEERCRRCGLPRPCSCPPWDPPPSLPRYRLLDLDDPRLQSATVLGHDDGEVDGRELNDQWLPACEEIGIPGTYAPRVAVASRRVRPRPPTYTHPQPKAPRKAAANPRDVNDAYRAQLKKASGWMSQHIGHDDRWGDVGLFQVAANKAARIPYDYGKRKWLRESASPAQLKDCAEWMLARITEHCDSHDCRLPTWFSEEAT
jgi:superfamily II DNA or RNA helicase